MQDTALKTFGIDLQFLNLFIIRILTNHPEYCYYFHNLVGKDTEFTTAYLACKMHQPYFNKKSRGLIFCTEVLQSEKIGQLLGCCVCNSSTSNYEEELERWRNASLVGDQWMSATSYLSHGIDLGDILVVIFAGLPYELIEMVQAASHGERLGQASFIVILQFAGPEKYTQEDLKLQKPINCWASNFTECQCLLISIIMNGARVSCKTLLKAQFCDICDSSCLTVSIFLTASTDRSTTIYIALRRSTAC